MHTDHLPTRTRRIRILTGWLTSLSVTCGLLGSCLLPTGGRLGLQSYEQDRSACLREASPAPSLAVLWQHCMQVRGWDVHWMTARAVAPELAGTYGLRSPDGEPRPRTAEEMAGGRVYER